MNSPQVARMNTSADERDSDKMMRLIDLIPELSETYKILKSIGKGSFSSVYLGQSNTDEQKSKVALKHIIPTSHPSRVLMEIWCLKKIGGVCNVVGLTTCFRRMNHIVVVMPYFQSDSIMDYAGCLSPTELRDYLANLLVALNHVHKFKIIHRDVKPSNFLYNRKLKRYLLVDFGLAQEVGKHDTPHQRTKVFSPHTPKLEAKIRPVKRKLPICSPEKGAKKIKLDVKPSAVELVKSVADMEISFRRSPRKVHTPVKRETPLVPVSSNSLLDSPSKHTRQAVRRRPFYRNTEDESLALPLTPSIACSLTERSTLLSSNLTDRHRPTQVGSNSREAKKHCRCYGAGKTCSICSSRPHMVAPRAGTPGFRPPEVLVRSKDQTTAVDIWACGVSVLCIASGRSPFFRAPDDQYHLAELCCLFSTKGIRKAAAAHNKLVICSEEFPGVSLSKLCKALRVNGACVKRNTENMCTDCLQCTCICPDDTNIATTTKYLATLTKKTVSVPPTEKPLEKCKENCRLYLQSYPAQFYSLLSQLLEPNSKYRISALKALKHPFLKDACIS